MRRVNYCMTVRDQAKHRIFRIFYKKSRVFGAKYRGARLFWLKKYQFCLTKNLFEDIALGIFMRDSMLSAMFYVGSALCKVNLIVARSVFGTQQLTVFVICIR